MALMASRRALTRVSVPRTLVTRRWETARAGQPTAPPQASGGSRDQVLKTGAKRDPELYILLAIMSGAFGLAGFYFGRKPTAATSESSVSMAEGTMPWQTGDKGDGEDFKYMYHPRGDKSQAPKNAPSALNVVIVPNVTLPEQLHEKFNKWGKDGY